jgi:LAO/AO transport system kinase
VAESWDMVLDHRRQMEASGHLAARRSGQALEWMRELVGIALEDSFRGHAAVAARLPGLEEAVSRGQVTPFAASRELLQIYRSQEK